MMELTFILLIAALIGTQLGIVAVLNKRGIELKRAFTYSAILYIYPFLIVIAHIAIFKDRHILLEELYSERKLTEKEFEHLKNRVDKFGYKSIAVQELVKDLFTPNDNISLILKFATMHYKNKKSARSRRYVFDDKQSQGLFEITLNVVKAISSLMKEHAKSETIERKVAH